MSLAVFECIRCGTRVFPQRYCCHGCGGGQWREVEVAEGTVEETTVVRHRMGAGSRPEALLATVATAAGPAVIAKLEAAADRGQPVRLRRDADGTIVASP